MIKCNSHLGVWTTIPNFSFCFLYLKQDSQIWQVSVMALDVDIQVLNWSKLLHGILDLFPIRLINLIRSRYFENLIIFGDT